MKISKTILLSFTAASFLALSSCEDYGDRSEQHDERSEEIMEDDLSQDDKATEAQNQTIEEKSQVLLDQYIKLKNALVSSDAEKARSIAKRMQPILENGESNGEIDRVNEAVNEIANTGELEEQREHFHKLSQQMYQLVQNTKANDQEMYWSHCPMALDNQGAYWLSEVEEIRNPYFGDKMMKCGKVSETLAATN